MKKPLLSITAFLILMLTVQNTWAQTKVEPEKKSAVPVPVPVKPKASTLQKPVPAATVRYVDTAKNTDPTLNGQYKFMLSRSKTSNGYKVINSYRLTTLWQSVTDTLKAERAEFGKSKAKILAQEKTIAELKELHAENDTTVNSTPAVVEAPITAADQLDFLGMTLTKSTYHTIVWSIIGLLAVALAIVIARSTKSILEAKHRTQLYDEVATEFQNFKTKSNEKERKMARELQDERNKLDELLNKNR